MSLTLQELDYLDKILSERESAIRSQQDVAEVKEIQKAVSEFNPEGGLGEFMKSTLQHKLKDALDYIQTEPDKLFRLRAKLLTIKDELILAEATSSLPQSHGNK